MKSRYFSFMAPLVTAGLLNAGGARAADPLPPLPERLPGDPEPGELPPIETPPPTTPDLIAPPSGPVPETTGAPTETVKATATEAPGSASPPTFVIGLKLGGAINVFNSLGAGFTPELELGVILPPVDGSFEIFLAGRYDSASDKGESDPDARLPGDGVASWTVTREAVALGLGLRFRVPMDGMFRPYVAAGARLYLLSTEVSGAANGETFGTNEETGTAVGFLFQIGGELSVGPGAFLIEVAVNGAPLDQTVLADTNASSLDFYLGYRFMF